MHQAKGQRRVLVDGSELIVESIARAGAEVFIGYPITPANRIFEYSGNRFEIVLAAPDEITVLQWMAGFSATGKLPVTATSFPGLALMVESINMAYMMELPMVIILVQRLGPSTGSATCGAQGDLSLLSGLISGGYPIPTLCISKTEDCWDISAAAVEAAIGLRSPVILLTSKEMVITTRSFEPATLKDISPVRWDLHSGGEGYQPYHPEGNLVPQFLPLGNDYHQVRFTSSSHDRHGLLRHGDPEVLANTLRLREKVEQNLPTFLYYELDEEEDAQLLVTSYGVTAPAAREAVATLRQAGTKVSLLVAKTLFPLPLKYLETMERYRRVVIAEENQNGQFRHLLFGQRGRSGVSGVNAVGRMIAPQDIVMEVDQHGQ
jgi:2-oxoglutarate ferredoxin oxidoreductase subunit alpha